MLTRSAISSRVGARFVARLVARQASTVPEHVGPIRGFFKAVPMPVEAYPLAALVVTMLGWATYHSAKHIREDRDHLRWYSGAGGVKYTEPQWRELPIDL